MFRLQRISLSVMVIAVLSMACAGCAKQQDDSKRFGKTAEKVSGTLTYAGNPVKDARIQLSSKETAAAIITTVDGGDFTFEDPVPIGNYKVVVLTPEEAAPETGVKYEPKKYDDIPLKYRDDFNSDLTAEIKEGENDLKLDMKP